MFTLLGQVVCPEAIGQVLPGQALSPPGWPWDLPARLLTASRFGAHHHRRAAGVGDPPVAAQEAAQGTAAPEDVGAVHEGH